MSPIQPRNHNLSQTEINEVFRQMHASGDLSGDASKHALLRRQGAVARELAAWQVQQAAAGGVPDDDGKQTAATTDAGPCDATRRGIR